MYRVASRLTAAVIGGLLAISALPASATADIIGPILPIPSTTGCDPLDPSQCLFPFPNDVFTTPDPTTDTGLRVNFNPLAMPRNGAEVTEGGEGKPVDPTEWNRNDGFSPGSMIMTYVPGLDLHQTWGTADRAFSTAAINEQGYFDYRDQVTDIDLYKSHDAPIVIINTETGGRHPFWSELDSHPGAVEAGERALILRPARNFDEGTRYIVALRDLKDSSGGVMRRGAAFDEGTRYIVALRNLKDSSGGVIRRGAAFDAYVNGTATDAARQARYSTDIFPVLENAGIGADDLYLAWDFTVASERNLSERVLHMRDLAFAQLGDTDLANLMVEGDSPEFVVDGTEDREDTWTDAYGQQHTQAIRRVTGRVTVPNFLDRIQQTEGHVRGNELPYDAPAPGSRLLDLDLDGLPDQNPVESTVRVPFVCDVPLNGEENHVILYGHGLLGTKDQIGDIKTPRRDGPFLGCAADWWGMSSPDLPTVAAILTDLSQFPSLPDRAQQGFLNFLFIGRAGVHPDGFATDPAFQDEIGTPLVDVSKPGERTTAFYDGNSQGGIMGGSLMAIAPDFSRAILGVPGMNYSTLLNRSVDWEGELAVEADIPAYSVPYYESYRDPLERQLGFALLQMLWDRGEANGYAAHMTSDPYPNTPRHEIMLQAAFSDHQVTNHAAEVEARTIGATIMPGLAPGRHWAMKPYWSRGARYPLRGSALIYWDSGNATPPNGNLPPSEGGDPHGHPRSEPAASWQEAHFLLTGWMVDVCSGGYYVTDNNPLNNGTPSCRPPLRPAGSWPYR